MKLIKRHNKRTKPPEGGDLISTLDLGAAKYSCSIARLSETGDGFEPDVLGVGQVEAPKKSTVSDREQAIRGAIDSAERMAGETISEVALLVSGRYLTSTRVAVDLELPRGIVTEEDVTECFWEAAGSGTDGRMPLSLTPIQYRVGGDIEREPPIGFQATELSVEALLIDARSTPVENIKQLVENCGVDVARVLPRPRAAAVSTLIEDEKELGVMVIDFGAKHTEFSVFENGSMTACGGIPVGGNHITQDISQIFGTQISAAERLKTLHGVAFSGPSDDLSIIDVPQLGTAGEVASHSRAELSEVIEPRLDEIIALVIKAAERAGAKTKLIRRIVATGGGALLLGLLESLERKIGAKARLGRANGFLSAPEAAYAPQFAASLGGLRLIADGGSDFLINSGKRFRSDLRAKRNAPKRQGLGRVSGWLFDNF